MTTRPGRLVERVRRKRAWMRRQRHGLAQYQALPEPQIAFEDYRRLVQEQFERNVRFWSGSRLPHAYALTSDEFFAAWRGGRGADGATSSTSTSCSSSAASSSSTTRTSSAPSRR